MQLQEGTSQGLEGFGLSVQETQQAAAVAHANILQVTRIAVQFQDMSQTPWAFTSYLCQVRAAARQRRVEQE